MKNIIALSLALAMLVCFAGCGNMKADPDDNTVDGTIGGSSSDRDGLKEDVEDRLEGDDAVTNRPSTGKPSGTVNGTSGSTGKEHRNVNGGLGTGTTGGSDLSLDKN